VLPNEARGPPPLAGRANRAALAKFLLIPYNSMSKLRYFV